MINQVLSRFRRRDATVAVVGLGYVGLPLAVEFAQAGLHVIGIDTDPNKVRQIVAGESPVQGIPPELVDKAVRSGHLRAVTEFSGVVEAHAVVLCVPTPLGSNREPDLSYIEKAIASVIPYLQPGALISLESTTYPGTTEELIAQPLRQLGKEPGRDVFVCFSPERVDPGNPKYHTTNTPKVVGGITPACLEVGCALYQTCIPVVHPVSSTKAAEMSKLLENTFRAVNIGFINEMALLCERLGINVWEVIGAAATKPFGFMPFYPGPGIGGHCIPLDPAYLAWKARERKFFTRFIELAQDVNESMPRHVVQRLADILNTQLKPLNGSTIILLGMTYKPNVDDLRESPSLEVYELLVETGARVLISDPYVSGFKDSCGRFIECTQLTPELLKHSDCVVILTAHSCVDYDLVLDQSNLVFDTRNAVKRDSPKLMRLGAPLPVHGNA